MRVSAAEKRFIDFAAKLAWGMQGTRRPEWYFKELVDGLADVAWMPDKDRECAKARALHMLKSFAAMDNLAASLMAGGEFANADSIAGN